MDLNTVTEFRQISHGEAREQWQKGHAWLAGGTWLFSEPQLALTTLIDTEVFQWPALTADETGLEIAATCKIAELDAWSQTAPEGWTAAPLIRESCRALLASFKIWNEATVGGNLCMSLPAGAMISLTAALEGVCTLWPAGGGEKQAPVIDFVTGNNKNLLQPGDLLRSIFLPAAALRKRYTLRRFSLTQLGRSSVFLIGTLGADGEFLLTITASTVRPVQLRFAALPEAAALKAAVDSAVPEDLYLEDPHGTPAHRRHLTYYFAEEIRREFAGLES